MTAPGVVGTVNDSGHWDNNGVPDYLESNLQEIDADLLEQLNESFPEYDPVPQAHPQYLDKSIQKNLFLTELANVWLTFVEEGAGYRNAVGIYTYSFDPNDADTYAPSSFADIQNTRTIVFPNCSKPRKGGNLNTGATVHLGQFPANTAIGIFLVPNGFNASSRTIKSGVQAVYSDHKFNTENEWVQTVLLKDEVHSRWIIGFEDIMRPNGDADFNDCLLYFTADPIIAVQETNLLQLSAATPINSSKLSADRSGLHLDIEETDLSTLKNGNASGDYYRIVHTMQANDEEHANLLERLFGYVIAEGLTIDRFNKKKGSTRDNSILPYETEQNRVTRTGNTIEVQYLVEHDDVRQFTYLLRVFKNLDDGTVIDEFHDYTQFRVLELLEAFYVQEPLPQTISIALDEVEPTVSLQSSEMTTTYLANPQIWGDPHVVAMNGKTYTLPDSEDGTVVLLFEDKSRDLRVKTELWHHPKYKDLDAKELEHVNETTFMHFVSFEHGQTRFVVDLDSVDLRFVEQKLAKENALADNSSLALHIHELGDDLQSGERLGAIQAKHGYRANVRCVTLCKHVDGRCTQNLYRFELLSLPETEFHLNEVNLTSDIFESRSPAWTANTGRALSGALVDGKFKEEENL